MERWHTSSRHAGIDDVKQLHVGTALDILSRGNVWRPVASATVEPMTTSATGSENCAARLFARCSCIIGRDSSLLAERRQRYDQNARSARPATQIQGSTVRARTLQNLLLLYGNG